MSTMNAQTGSRSYGGRRRHGLGWVPWLALLLLALIAVAVYLLIHWLDNGDNSSQTTMPAAQQTAAPAPAYGSVPLVGGGGVAASPAAIANGQTASDSATVGTVLFAEQSASLDSTSKAVVDQAATLAKNRNAKRLTVTGYTDVVGNQPVNTDLAQERANAVASQLRSDLGSGITISTVAKGEADPVAPNTNSDGSDNPQGRQQNRRAVIAIS
jgi:OmpA-OmpF porin, OOP family